jgi:hypothetical protein
MVIHDVIVGAPPDSHVRGATMPARRQKPIVMAYERQQFRAGFLEPEYDLAEIQKAQDTEGYLRLSFDKHEELILKNQWRIVSQNEQVLEHVHRRLTEISWGQDQPIEEILEQGVEDFVELSNVFYVLARREGQPRYNSKFGRRLFPISGIFSPNAASMKPFIELNKKGVREIKEWWQMVNGRIRKKFRPRDIVHIAFRRKKGHVFGTPYVIPVLDDILAMRRMEELVEILVHKHAFPFFHYQVGTDQDPATEFDNGRSEIEDVKIQVSNMPFEGGLVTSHRHVIQVLGTGKTKVIDAKPYLEYYEARVMSGLNLSGIDLGRGETANRATAQTMSKGLADRCTRMQLKFASQFTFRILDELVMEMGTLPTPENRAYLVFPTIDTEERRAAENHAMAMFQGHIWTESEARIEMGRDQIKDEQRKDMYFERVEKNLALIKAVDESSGLGSKSATANREQPENKSKKLTSKPRVAANDAVAIVEGLWDQLGERVIADLHGMDILAARVMAEVEKHIDSWLTQGMQQYMDEFNPSRDMYLGMNIKEGFLDDILNPAAYALRANLHALDRMKSTEQGALLLQNLLVAGRVFGESVGAQAVYYGYAKAAQLDKKKWVRWVVAEGCCQGCLKKAAEPMRIHKFKWGELHHCPSCVLGLTVASE